MLNKQFSGTPYAITRPTNKGRAHLKSITHLSSNTSNTVLLLSLYCHNTRVITRVRLGGWNFDRNVVKRTRSHVDIQITILTVHFQSLNRNKREKMKE